jgi:maltose/moltooligosaccharide transporter
MNQKIKKKPQLNFWQLWNLSVGFFGVQFGWTLQMTNTSAIYEYLGANPEQIPILWLAAPLSGLIAQPLIGYFSDRTWVGLGRRRPYFLVGAILSSIALILMPNSSSLWMAAGLLWILDTSINVTTEPFRAFLGDVLPRNQKTRGFAMQSFFIGCGAVIASLTPWLLNHVFGLSIDTNETSIPLTVKLSFYFGAVVLLGTVMWTVFNTKEYPPENIKRFRLHQQQTKSLSQIFQGIWELIQEMPPTMKQLAYVQFFTWLGMFCFFLYFPPAVAHNIFGALDEHSELYTRGIEWAGICIGVYNFSCFVFSWLLPKLAQATDRKVTHSMCLFIGGCGIISLLWVSNKYLMFIPMICFGISWASILAIPYSILSRCLPSRNMGLYMGIFNFFIVIPQIIAALGLGWLMVHVFAHNRLLAVVLGGFCFLIASGLIHLVEENSESNRYNLTLESSQSKI